MKLWQELADLDIRRHRVTVLQVYINNSGNDGCKTYYNGRPAINRFVDTAHNVQNVDALLELQNRELCDVTKDIQVFLFTVFDLESENN